MILIELKDISRSYRYDAGEVHALRHVNLTIHAGEMVAIVGSSGSGKSTLMNILGCIDHPTSGSYLVAGMNSKDLTDEQVSRLRCEYFGFIFQSYHLLPGLNALMNVELPAFYAGEEEVTRHQRARELLRQFGLGQRATHNPSQLSGGQQQRVSIARALMNGGHIILADEPTGALDSQSGREVMAILRSLQQEGHTIIIITHDMGIAENTDRIIQLRDGEIISDTSKIQKIEKEVSDAQLGVSNAINGTKTVHFFSHLLSAIKTAFFALKTNKLRSLLTILGIVIGIASVVAIVSLGQAMRASVLDSFGSMADLALVIYPHSDSPDPSASQSLKLEDVDVLARHPYFKSVVAQVETNERLRRSRYDASGQIMGVNIGGYKKHKSELTAGRDFRLEELKSMAQVVLINDAGRKKLFPEIDNPIGEFVLVGKLPCRIIGIVTPPANSPFIQNDSIYVWMPYTTAAVRLMGKHYVGSISVLLNKGIGPDLGASVITDILEKKHHKKDIYINNNQAAFASIDSSTMVLTVGLGCLAGISLLVGGIGVMNIMLVSVSERVREIGIRRAIGASKQDILMQFLVESVCLCIVGGAVGTLLGIIICMSIKWFPAMFPFGSYITISISAIIISLTTCLIIGVGFGVFPARRASQLNPSLALARE